MVKAASKLYTLLAIVFAMLSVLSLSNMHPVIAIVLAAAAWMMFRSSLQHQSQPPDKPKAGD